MSAAEPAASASPAGAEAIGIWDIVNNKCFTNSGHKRGQCSQCGFCIACPSVCDGDRGKKRARGFGDHLRRPAIPALIAEPLRPLPARVVVGMALGAYADVTEKYIEATFDSEQDKPTVHEQVSCDLWFTLCRC